ncbi:MAG: hypothetical protein J0H98_08445 [Solirubrobacterales bacterium]|nr:hypothetical protein [Solirubrobacterales bacterium]
MLRSPLRQDGATAARISLLLIGLAALFAGVVSTPAQAASTKRADLGAKNLESLKPNCGRDFTRQCTVEGKMTGFQSLSGKTAGRNFVVPFDGKVVAWAISLADVTRRDVEYNGQTQPAQLPTFGLYFGTTTSQARIAVLRQVEKKKKGGPRYKMVRQSPLITLNPYFGTTAHFALEQPLNVIKGQIVALTTPTWIPAIWKPRACDNLDYGIRDPDQCERFAAKYTWRASRVPQGKDECELGVDRETLEPNEPLAKSRPQQIVDSIKRYRCYYGANVLLYSATVVGK